VWLLIGFCALNAVDLLIRSEAVNAAYGPFGVRVLRWPIAIAIIVDPLYENIRSDPRWPIFLESIGRSPQQLAAIESDVTLPD